MKISDQLKAAKALISTPETWTQGRCARNSSNQSVHVMDSTACKWCSIGALRNVYGMNDTHKNKEYTQSRSYLAYASHGFMVPVFNDKSPHSEVMAMWDRAIHKAMADEQ